MNGTHEFLITLGSLLLVGLATDMLGKRTALPRVSLLILLGTIIGPAVLDLIPAFFLAQFEIIAQMALVMVGFLMGSKFTREAIAENGRAILSVSIIGAMVTGLVVLIGLLIMGQPMALAILLACIATATDGIATVDVILEAEKNTPFSRLLMDFVALDDGWGLILFSIGLATVMAMTTTTAEDAPLLLFTLRELGGAVVLGILVGLPAAYLTGRIKPGQPMRSEALGLVFLCGGLALMLEVSLLIATMVMGMMIANFARHHEYPFYEIEGMEWPVLSVFFVLAGASLDPASLASVGWLGAGYIVLRLVGKVAGGLLGGAIGGCDTAMSRWLGLAMMPHAGAAMGMALVASSYFPQYRDTVLTIIICATIVFEIIGPLLARIALFRNG